MGLAHRAEALAAELSDGEIVAVAGRSGSAKTTLLTIVAGWEQPEAGPRRPLRRRRSPARLV